jgi:ABC-type nitrate/sulfonate/bicarbonate transport system substrate-binding protein
MPRSMRLYLLLGNIFFIAAALAGSSLAQPKPKLRPLHVALANHSVSMTAIYVAKHLGIFEQYGYDARVLVLEPRAGIAALLAGGLDFYTAIGSTSDFMLVANKEIQSIEQIKGKFVGGYTPQGTVNVILAEMLRRKGLRSDEYKIVNSGTARAAALMSGNVPVALVNSVETVKLVKLGFHVLARAADELEMPLSGLGMSVGSMQAKREFLRPGVQAVLEAIRVIATQKDKAVTVLMKQLSLTQDEGSYVYEAIRTGWALDGKPTTAAMKLDAELSQRDMGLKELPRPEQTYDFSFVEDLTTRK